MKYTIFSSVNHDYELLSTYFTKQQTSETK